MRDDSNGEVKMVRALIQRDKSGQIGWDDVPRPTFLPNR